MVWTTPMTAVAFEPFSAAEYNTHIRDNLLQTGVAKAGAAHEYLVSTGLNTVDWRLAGTSGRDTENSTTSTTYLELTNSFEVGLNTGTSAIVIASCIMRNTTAGSSCSMSYGVTGATSIDPSDSWRLMTTQDDGGYVGMSRVSMQTSLNPGFNIFRPWYRSGGGNAFFHTRSLIVIPF